MDSPSPHSTDHDVQFIGNVDESERSLASLWNSIRPSYKALSVLVVSLVLVALCFSSLPLWRPIAAMALQKIWDLLRFLVLTTSIGLGILNSRLWRGDDSAASNSRKENSSSSSQVIPFVAGMFYGEVQHSCSFSDKEMEASENGSMHSCGSESDADASVATSRDSEHDASPATLADQGHNGNEASALRAGSDGQQPYSDQHATMLVNGPPFPASMRSVLKAKDSHPDREDEAMADEETAPNPYIHVRRNVVNVATIGKDRVVKPFDEAVGLAAVAEDPKQGSTCNIIHRSSSSEFPILQEWGSLAHGKDVQKKCSSEKAASSTAFDAASNVNKHSRSRSAYDFNELLVQLHPRSTSGSSSQLSRRRNVSLSCDLDKEYSNLGMPAWLASLPSPPEPPLTYSYDGGENGEEAAKSKQDESSRRKAFIESLAPWRAATNTVPVNIPTSTQSHDDPTAKQDKTYTSERQRVSTPLSSPSASNTMGSPSASELNKKADAFIARFHERMKLQRLESLERSRQRDV